VQHRDYTSVRENDPVTSLLVLRSTQQTDNKKFELMLTRRAKAYSSSGLVVWLKIGVFTLS